MTLPTQVIFGVDLEIVWRVVEMDVPTLLAVAVGLLAVIETQSS